MSLNESIVEDAALEWFLLRQVYSGQVVELGCLQYLIPVGKEDLNMITIHDELDILSSCE